MRVGLGYDVHRLKKGNPMILGGIHIPHDYGPDGHSDADVLTHALIDAILGAMAWGDIGSWFPDSDQTYKNADSIGLLREVMTKLQSESIVLNNLDATVVTERPKLRSYINDIRKNLAEQTGLTVEQVSVKATTSEEMGFVGRKEGIAVHCIVSLS